MPIRARRTRLLWRSLLTAALAALMATLMSPGAAQGAAPGPRTPDESKPVYAYDNAIRESVWVDTGLDGDADGRTDRVAVDIVRPRELDRTGRRIPVIMDASPYYACCGRGNESQKKTYDAQGDPVQFPLYYDNYFVPRGYGYVAVDLAGTNRSDGCVDVGGRSDVRSAKAVVDWLNGRGRGYTSRTGQERAKASWSNGRTGMIGKSYDGTVAQGVAATGVKGLKTIVPIGAISSWYDYYFQQGAPLYDSGPEWLSDAVESPEARARCGAVQQRLIDGAPRSGDWTRLWSERNHVPDADKVRASVFVVHGMQDLNVRAKHFGQWWDALAKNGVDRRSGSARPVTSTPSTSAGPTGSAACTAGSTMNSSASTTASTASRWPTSSAPPTGGPPTASGPRAPPARSRSAPPRARRPASARSAHVPPRTTETFTDNPDLGETDWAERIDMPTPEKAGFHHQAPHQRPAPVRLLRGVVHRDPHDPHRPSLPRSSSTSAPPPSATTPPRARASPRSPNATAGARAPRRQLLLPHDAGEDGRCGAHRLQPRLGRPRHLGGRPPRAPPHPGQAAHPHYRPRREQPRRAQGPPPRPDQVTNRRGARPV
ncbi:Xaa-Pro dipeptidyl-peptidase [Streptomyces alboniger]